MDLKGISAFVPIQKTHRVEINDSAADDSNFGVQLPHDSDQISFFSEFVTFTARYVICVAI